MERDEKKEKIADKLLGVAFNKKSTTRILLVILVIGLVLRIFAAINLSMQADDSGHAINAINFINSGQLEIYHQSASLWHLFTDLSYKMIGIGTFASRFASVLFGTMSIIVIFLLTREFFDEKKALIASFLLAISPWAIKNMVSEMDSMVMFFVLFSMYYFVLGLKDNRNRYIVYAGVLMGLGVITKLYALFFIPGMIIYALYKNKKKNNKIIDKNISKKMVIFGLLALLFFVPAMTHNYLLYKDKGFMDFQFTRIFGLGEAKAEQLYSWDAGWKAKPDYKGLIFGNSKQLPWSKMPTSLYSLQFLLYGDPIVFVFGILGLIFIFKRNRDYFLFFILCFGIPFIYLASIILLPKHHLYMLLLFIPVAAFQLDNLLEYINKKLKIRKRHVLCLILIVYLVFLGFTVPFTPSNFYGKSAINQLMSVKQDHIDSNSLVVVDARVYRGWIGWMFNDKHYIESSYLVDILNNQDKLPGSKRLMTVYYVECEKDDCGWGTIANQPDFNKSMEQITDYFRNNSIREIGIKAPENEKYYFPLISRGKGENYFAVYKTAMLINENVQGIVDKTHTFFLYPIGFDEKITPIFDKFQIWGLGIPLWYFARFIQFSALILGFVFVGVLIYILLIKIDSRKNE